MNEPAVSEVSAEEYLEPGKLYTVGRLTVRCVRHEPGEPPRLKLTTLCPAFIHALAQYVMRAQLGAES